jgi:hypothetical protein
LLVARLLTPGVLPATARLAFGNPAKLAAGLATLCDVTGGWVAIVDTPHLGRFVRLQSKDLAVVGLARQRAAAAAAAADG